MKSILFLALAVAMVMGAPFVDPGTDEEAGVLILNDKNFETTLAANDYLFVEFYAPWCVIISNIIYIYKFHIF